MGNNLSSEQLCTIRERNEIRRKKLNEILDRIHKLEVDSDSDIEAEPIVVSKQKKDD
jgi:hypothetical protein